MHIAENHGSTHCEELTMNVPMWAWLASLLSWS